MRVGLGQPASPVPPWDETARTITRFLPQPGIPEDAFVDAEAPYAARGWTNTSLRQQSVPVPSLKPRGLFDTGDRVQVMPDGTIRPTGPIAEGIKSTIDFKKATTGQYTFQQDSEFIAKTAPIKRVFTIQEDIRPEASFYSPETMEIDGLGTTIPAIPIDEDFDAFDRRRGMSGFGTTIPTMPIDADFDLAERTPGMIKNLDQSQAAPVTLDGYRVPAGLSFEDMDAMLGQEAAKTEKAAEPTFWQKAEALIKGAEAQKLVDVYKKYRREKKPKAAPAPEPMEPVRAAPAISAGIDTTTVLIIAGAGVVALGGILFLVMRRK